MTRTQKALTIACAVGATGLATAEMALRSTAPAPNAPSTSVPIVAAVPMAGTPMTLICTRTGIRLTFVLDPGPLIVRTSQLSYNLGDRWFSEPATEYNIPFTVTDTTISWDVEGKAGYAVDRNTLAMIWHASDGAVYDMHCDVRRRQL